jgi:molecular chaperone GrpE
MVDKKVKTKKVKAKIDEVAELKGQLLRVQADFDNYRKRTQKEREEFAQFLNTDLIMRIIPTLDNFQLALKHLPAELEGNAWVQGIWHIEKQLEQTLSDEGVTEIPSLGQKFDHNIHEAIEEVLSEKPPGEIIEEILRGYKLKDKIIRHAKVKVSKGNKEGEKNE